MLSLCWSIGSNPDSSPDVSQYPININERSVVKGSAGDDGKEGRRKETSFSPPPSHRPLRTSAVIVSRDHNLTESVVKSSWSRTQICLFTEGLNSNFPTGMVFLTRKFPPREFTVLDLLRYSALPFKLNRTAF